MIAYVKPWFGLKRDRRGVTALEYGLIAGVIVAMVAVGFSYMSESLSTKFAAQGNCVTMGAEDPSYATTCGAP